MAKNKKWLWQIPFLLFLIIGTVWVIRQQHLTAYQHNRGTIFGTTYTITYQSDRDLQKEIEAKLKAVDNSLSPFNEKSIISKVNRNEKVTVDNMFREVFEKALSVSEDTEGAFDITVAPLVNAWGFGFKNNIQPTTQTIDSLLRSVGYKKVKLTKNGQVIKSDSCTMLDCSAIAKGFGCDVVARFLHDQGITNYMIEIGGEVVTRGVSEKRVPWHIGVIVPTEDSLQTEQQLQAILNVTDKAMATSGNYRNFYYKGGKRYAHTIDPRTGYPVAHSLLSATVLASDCATADAYATSFMVMGMEKAKAVLDRHPELMAYFIYSDPVTNENAVWYTPSLANDLKDVK